MKKAIFFLAAMLVLPLTSWQSYEHFSKMLTVHETDDPNSAVCYYGLAEDYDGHCVQGYNPTHQYVEKHSQSNLED